MENAFCDKPMAVPGLQSYRYRGPFGWIMIGAKDNADAFREAARSTAARLQPERLEVWDPVAKTYCPALKAIYELVGSCIFKVKVFELDSNFKVVAFDSSGNVRSGLSLWAGNRQVAIDYANQFKNLFAA